MGTGYAKGHVISDVLANEAVMYAFIRMSIQRYTGLSSTDLSR